MSKNPLDPEPYPEPHVPLLLGHLEQGQPSHLTKLFASSFISQSFIICQQCVSQVEWGNPLHVPLQTNDVEDPFGALCNEVNLGAYHALNLNLIVSCNVNQFQGANHY